MAEEPQQLSSSGEAGEWELGTTATLTMLVMTTGAKTGAKAKAAGLLPPQGPL